MGVTKNYIEWSRISCIYEKIPFYYKAIYLAYAVETILKCFNCNWLISDFFLVEFCLHWRRDLMMMLYHLFFYIYFTCVNLLPSLLKECCLFSQAVFHSCPFDELNKDGLFQVA